MKKPLVDHLRHFFSIGSSGRQEFLSKLLEEHVRRNTAMQLELQYMYLLLFQHEGCYYEAHFDCGPKTVLFATFNDTDGVNIVVHLPQEQMEVARAHAQPSGHYLVIDYLKLDFSRCNKELGTLLLKKLIGEAQSRRLSKISKPIDGSNNPQFDDISHFYQEIGFEINYDSGKQTGELLYNL